MKRSTLEKNITEWAKVHEKLQALSSSKEEYAYPTGGTVLRAFQSASYWNIQEHGLPPPFLGITTTTALTEEEVKKLVEALQHWLRWCANEEVRMLPPEMTRL